MSDEDRLHIIEGLLTALDRLGEVNEAVRTSATRDDARTALVERLGVSTVQANHILDMTIGRQTSGARADLAAEAERLRSTAG